MQSYLRLCLQNWDIYNSLEFRLFVDLENHIGNYLQLPSLKTSFCFDCLNILFGEFCSNLEVFMFICSSEKMQEENSIQSLVSGFKNWWSSSKNQPSSHKNVISFLIPKFKKKLEYHKEISFTLDQKVSTCAFNNELNMLFLGYKNGTIGNSI